MKPRIPTALLLFISAYSPLLLILAVRDFDFDVSLKWKHPMVSVLLVVLSLISVLLLWAVMKKMPRGAMSAKLVAVRDRSTDLIGYTIPYIICFIASDFSKMEDILTLVGFLALLFLLSATSNSLFLNPILLLMHYRLYDIEYEYDGNSLSTTVFSKTDLRVGKYYFLKSITAFLYLITPSIEEDKNDSSN